MRIASLSVVHKPAFFRTEIAWQRFVNRMINDDSFKMAAVNFLRRNNNFVSDCSIIDEYARDKISQKEENYLTIQILADEGAGKSGVAQFFAQRYQKFKALEEFQASQIGMHFPDFMSLVPIAKRGWFLILDEQTKSHGVGSRRIIDDIINMKETLRQNEVSFIFVAPTEKMLQESDVDLTIEIIARDGAFVLCAYKHRTQQYQGLFVIELEWNNAVWREYNEGMKREYIIDAKTLNFKKNDYDSLAVEIMANPKFMACTLRRERKLVLEELKPNMTLEEKHMILTKIDMIEKGL